MTTTGVSRADENKDYRDGAEVAGSSVARSGAVAFREEATFINELGNELQIDTVVVFQNRRGTYVKLLWHTARDTFCDFNPLDRGTYRIPLAVPPDARSVMASPDELLVLLDGLDEARLTGARECTRGAKYLVVRGRSRVRQSRSLGSVWAQPN